MEKEKMENKKALGKKRVLLGMSGGVDSSVSAILLKQAGYEVIGATMLLWNGNSFSTIEDAKKVCEELQIEHHVINLEKEFKEKVINNFISCYECAKTPNPCVECNKYFKFQTFYEEAKKLSCDYIATGHYAKIQWSKEYKQYVLTKSKADKKDQTYFLYPIPQNLLDKILFPLADFTDKTEIRKIAEENSLNVAKKKDSQEICFIPNNNYITFLEQNGVKKQKQGNIVLKDGTILGKHKGLIYYTIGQRKGLGISYEEPLYVLKLDKEKNEVIVGPEKELYKNTLQANELNFLIENIDLSKPIEVMAKIRYRANPSKAILKVEEKVLEANGKNEGNNQIKDDKTSKIQMATLTFKEPQRAITPGQSVVFYLNDIVLGGGKII
jgi:tRNA-specific 2-thiouridylase